MGKRPILFIFSLVAGLILQAQAEDSATVEVRRFITPSIYVDYGKLLTIPLDTETKYEGGLELTFKERIPFIVEIGSGTLEPKQAFSNGVYESKGIYFRVGGGYVAPMNPKNSLGITFRYGMSTFDETIRITVESPSGLQGVMVNQIDRSDIEASWVEAVIYSDRKLTNLFTVGMNIRFRVLIDYDNFHPVDVYAIPGYGRSFDNTIPAVNLFLKAVL